MAVRRADHYPSLICGWLIARPLLILCIIFHYPSPALADSVSQEYQLKAAFVFKFLGFIEWDDPARAKANKLICILGVNPFGNSFERLAKLEAENNPVDPPVVVRRLDSVNESNGCSILFVASSEESRLSAILEPLHESSVLTVSDIQGFAHRGGIIELVQGDQYLRFIINQEQAKRNGIHLSSQLLALASSMVMGVTNEFFERYIATA